MIETLEREARPLFDMLKQKYAQSLSRDADFAKYLQRIGKVYFDIEAPASMLDSILSLVK